MTEPDDRTHPLQRTVNPYKRWIASFVPEWLEMCPDLGQGEKLCYARLARYAGKDGRCFPSQESLAKDLGVSVSQIGRYVRRLKAVGLISAHQRGLATSNTYVFLEHPMMNGARERSGGTTTVQVQDLAERIGGDRSRINGDPEPLDPLDIRESGKRTIERESREEIVNIETIRPFEPRDVTDDPASLIPARMRLKELSETDADFKGLLTFLSSERRGFSNPNEKLGYMRILEAFLGYFEIRGGGLAFYLERERVVEATDKWTELGRLIERHSP